MSARAVVLALVALSLLGCGVKGKPIPPSEVQKERTDDADKAE